MGFVNITSYNKQGYDKINKIPEIMTLLSKFCYMAGISGIHTYPQGTILVIEFKVLFRFR